MLLAHNTRKQKEEIELFDSAFDKMAEFRANIKDDERMCAQTKEEIELEVERMED